MSIKSIDIFSEILFKGETHHPEGLFQVKNVGLGIDTIGEI